MTFVFEQLRFLVRGGTAANLATVNEVPLMRELVVERDTGKMKLGDGATAYNSLPYISGAISMRVHGGWIQFSSDGSTWEDLIAVADLVGPAGPAGASVEMRVSGGYIQWRQVGSPTWTNLTSLASITGPTGPNGINGTDGVDGREVEMRADGTYLQWRYVGDPAWTNLIDVSAIGGAGATVAQITFGAGDRINPLTVGDKAEIPVMYDCNLLNYDLIIQTDDGLDGSIVVDLRRTTFLDFPTGFSSLCASAKPEIAGGRKSSDGTLPGWSTAIAAGDVVRATVESRSSNVTFFAIALRTEKS